MALAEVTVVDSTITVDVSGTSLLAPLVAAANAAKEDAETAQAAAESAAASAAADVAAAVAADADAAEAAAADAATILAALEDAVVTQIIGRPDVPSGTTSNSAAGTYVLTDPAIGDGEIIAGGLSMKSAGSPGTAQIKIEEEAYVGGVRKWVQVGSDIAWVLSPNTVNTYPTAIPILQGQRLGIYVPTAQALQRIVATAYGGGYDKAAGSFNETEVTAGAVPVTSNQLQIRAEMRVRRTDQWRVGIANSDRIIVGIDSHSQSSQTHRGKSWPAKVSLFSDYTFDNFGVAGNTAAEALTRIRSNTQTLGVLPYRDRGVNRFLFYGPGENDKGAGTNVANFQIDMGQIIETVKGLGASVTLASPHTLDSVHYGAGFPLIFRNLAEQHGCDFIDVTANARVMDFGTRYAGFWHGTHAGVRTNDIIRAPVERYLNDLGPPRQSMKLFRKRSGVSVTTVADLIFNDHFQRAKLFKEILVGTGALNVADEGIYDELNTFDTATHSELLNSEYEALQNGDAIAVDDYTLLEVTFPTEAKHIDQLTLTLSETAATVYARGGMLTATVTDGVPLGAWTALNGASGVYRLANSEIRRFMREEKISFLIYKSGGIAALTEPRIDWIGQPIEKPRRAGKTQGRPALGVEKLTNPDLGVATNWTATGTVSHVLKASMPDQCVPYGSTGRVTVDNTNYVSQAVTWTADNEKQREVEIRVCARRFPGIDDGTITQDSFDWGQLQIETEVAAGRVLYVEKVGLWWSDIILRTIAPIGTTGMTLYIRGASGSPALEVAKASFRFVDA